MLYFLTLREKTVLVSSRTYSFNTNIAHGIQKSFGNNCNLKQL